MAVLFLAVANSAWAASLSLSSPLFNGGDGVYVVTNISGQNAWKPVSGSSYLYFDVPASFTLAAGAPLYVQVTYYDQASGHVTVQYDSTNSAYASAETHVRSSCAGTLQFVSYEAALKNPRLTGRENGMADFRVSGYPPISRVVIQDTPFADANFQRVLTTPWLNAYTGPTRDDVDASSLRGKVVAGYQGWFGTPNDLNDGGWVHWCRNGTMIPDNFTIDMWPDLTLYDGAALVPAASVQTRSGKQAYLFSSSSLETTRLHFQWMRQHNIDGAFLQRFLNPNSLGADGRPEWVLANAREAANREGRIWAIEYDISGLNDSNVVTTLTRDWKWLVDSFHLLQDPRYCREGGRPVVVIWGLPFADRGISHDVANQVVDFFKNDTVYGSNYVVGGIPNIWSTQTAWYDHFQKYDGLLVWQPQNFNNDFSTFQSWGKDYYPHVWPGFSWANLQQQTNTTSYTPRNGGTYYWNKMYSAINSGANRMFIGMFDEYDEGTAIMPMTDDPPYPSVNYGRFLTNDNRASDWWMALSAEGRAMLLKQRALSSTMPTEAELANRSNIGFEAAIILGSTDQNLGVSRVDAADGHTDVETVGGKECRFNINTNTDLYFYFSVDDAFLYRAQGGSNLTVEVEYFDEAGSARLGLQYDGLSNVYQGHSKTITTTGASQWRTVRFEIADGYFGNRQNNGADFRLTASSGRIHIHRVWVRRVTGFLMANGPLTNLQTNSCTATGILTQDVFAEPWAAVWVYWGTSDGGTVKTNWEHTLFLGTNSHRGATAFSGSLTGFSTTATNYYRFYAANANGEAWADSTGVIPTDRFQAAVTLIATGAVWRYFDQTNDLGAAWRSNSFSDANWSSGPAMLGFGDANGILPATLVGSNRQWTTYFRRNFYVPDAGKVLSLGARLLRDDGAVVYLNGAEVWRDTNMPSGVITNTTPALANISGLAESTWLTNTLDASALVTGVNLLAVEMHQNVINSPDLTFNLELTGAAIVPQDPHITVTANSFSWPAEAGLYSLFTASNLSPNTIWIRATNSPILSNGIWEIAWPAAANASRFYRLQTP